MNRGILAAVTLAVAVSVVGCQQKAAPAATPASPSPGTLATEQDKTVYAIGLMMGRNLEQLDLTPAELEIVKKGLADSASGKKGEVELEAYGPKVQEFAQGRVAARAKVEKEKAKAFADAAAQEAGAVRTTSGLVFKSLQPGHGAAPAATDVVKVNYSGKFTNGTEFDSSAQHGGKPVEFKLNQVVPCWTEALQRMKVGEKARLICPSDIAYGDAGRPPVIPGGATLVFEIELLDIKK